MRSDLSVLDASRRIQTAHCPYMIGYVSQYVVDRAYMAAVIKWLQRITIYYLHALMFRDCSGIVQSEFALACVCVFSRKAHAL